MATLLNIEKLSKAYHQRIIFKDVTFAVDERQKIGLIGRNGAGKSTLLRMIIGQEMPDSGKIIKHDITRLGNIEQHEKINLAQTAQNYLETQTGQPSWQCAKIAGKFEITPDHLSQPISSLSGGFRMRLRLASMLLKDPNLFLLDEPTNYLDVHTQILLEKFLQNYNGAFIIVSHDREFLKRTCEQTLEIEQGDTIFYPRPIDEYLEYKKARLETIQNYNKKIDREQKHLQDFVDRFRYKASKAKQAQSRLKAIDRLEKIDINDPLATVHITIPGVENRKGQIFRAADLSIGYPDKTVATNIYLDFDRKEKVAIIGDNGQGKTTLLKTFASVLAPLGGLYRWTQDTKIAYYAQHVPAELNDNEQVWRYMRRSASHDILDEEVKRMAGNFLFDKNELEKNISMLSGGERARLCLAGLLLTKSNVLLLDEPTNHLDFETVEALGRALKNFVGTVIFISHNRTFVNSIATMIVEVKDGKVNRYHGNYEDYIYHLQNIIQTEDGSEKEISTEATTETTPAQKNDSRKQRREMKKIEEEIAELEKEKEILLKKQAKNPAKFGQGGYARLGEIVELIEEKETEWMKLSEATS
ncbi:MAG TPA: ABC-F family ATP-binding cassette domain-containing protein [Candidatus Magasanikbacteria bacterium]|nr:ABC-F family ATP-binding cassette domain-containing protein [Candidatus Magasanikbacteria bacterium]